VAQIDRPLVRVCDAERFLGGARDQQAVAVVPQRRRDQVPHRRFVLDDHGHVLQCPRELRRQLVGRALEHGEGPEVHGLTRSADGRIWVGDAATNDILVVQR